MLPTASIINSIILLSHHISMQCSAMRQRGFWFNAIQSDHSTRSLNYHGMQRLTAPHFKALIALLHRKPIFQMLLSLMRSLTGVLYCKLESYLPLPGLCEVCPMFEKWFSARWETEIEPRAGWAAWRLVWRHHNIVHFIFSPLLPSSSTLPLLRLLCKLSVISPWSIMTQMWKEF